MISKLIDTHMKDVLADGIRILHPVIEDASSLIKRHSWRTRKVLGESNGRIAYWRGWSSNLGLLADGYHTIYIDFVENILPSSQRIVLFGEEFASAIEGHKAFIVCFAANFGRQERSIINSSGFICREIGPGLHACFLVSPSDFVSQPPMFWAASVAKLANFQREVLHSSDPKESEIASANSLGRVRRLKDVLSGLQQEDKWNDQYSLLDIE